MSQNQGILYLVHLVAPHWILALFLWMQGKETLLIFHIWQLQSDTAGSIAIICFFHRYADMVVLSLG